MRRRGEYLLLSVMRLALLLLAASTVRRASGSAVGDKSGTLRPDDEEHYRPVALETTTTTTVAERQRFTAVRLTDDDGRGVMSEQDDEVEEGRHLMENFFRRYNTTALVDLVFVLDRSGSVPRKGWRSIVDFVKVGSGCQTDV